MSIWDYLNQNIWLPITLISIAGAALLIAIWRRIPLSSPYFSIGGSDDDDKTPPPPPPPLRDGVIYINRQSVLWTNLDENCKSRYWACGTTLRPVAERRRVEDMHRRGVKDVRIILPATEQGTPSLLQLEEYDRRAKGHSADNQAKAAKDAYTLFHTQIESLKIEEFSIFRLYTGVMYANITIIDDDAFISFYDDTGVGEHNFTLHFRKGTHSAGYGKVERLFDRLWNSIEPPPRKTRRQP